MLEWYQEVATLEARRARAAPIEACFDLRHMKKEPTILKQFVAALSQPFSTATAKWWLQGTARKQDKHCCWDKSNITYACDSLVPQKVHHSWPLCLDQLQAGPEAGLQSCLVYSFGIDNSWGYDDMMASQYGCEVHSFDPTQNLRAQHEAHKVPGVAFHYGGLSSNYGFCSKANTWSDERHDGMGGEMNTLAKWVSTLGHASTLSQRRISNRTVIFKIDCEGCEWDAFYQMSRQSPEVLDNIDVIQIELHTSPALQMLDFRDVNKFQTFFQYVFVEHGFRLWYHHNNLGQMSHRVVQKDLGALGLSGQQCCYEIGLARDPGWKR